MMFYADSMVKRDVPFEPANSDFPPSPGLNDVQFRTISTHTHTHRTSGGKRGRCGLEPLVLTAVFAIVSDSLARKSGSGRKILCLPDISSGLDCKQKQNRGSHKDHFVCQSSLSLTVIPFNLKNANLSVEKLIVNVLRFLKIAAILFALPGIVLPQSRAFASEQKTPSFRVKLVKPNSILDAKLDKDGAFTGRTIEHDGTPVVGAVVVVRSGQTEIGQSVTDEQGNFSVKNLKSGVYEVSSGATTGSYRFWSEATAPPSAKPHGLLVLGPNGARGQYGLTETIFGSNLGLILLVTTTALSAAALAVSVDAHNIAQDAKNLAKKPTSP